LIFSGKTIHFPFVFVLFLLVAYLIGSIPFGRIIGRGIAGIDITKKGSGNIGATNVARTLGLKWGALTLFFDMLKGIIPLSLFGLYSQGSDVSAIWIGLAALMGHQFSIFMGLKGGKGVATALGVYLIMAPLPCGIALGLFTITVYRSHFVSLGSMLAASSIPFLLWLFNYPQQQISGSLVMAALICCKHHQNILRLLKGEESAWKKRPS
jgi:glycerol-3-phosphate acyltransferase PlsY